MITREGLFFGNIKEAVEPLEREYIVQDINDKKTLTLQGLIDYINNDKWGSRFRPAVVSKLKEIVHEYEERKKQIILNERKYLKELNEGKKGIIMDTKTYRHSNFKGYFDEVDRIYKDNKALRDSIIKQLKLEKEDYNSNAKLFKDESKIIKAKARLIEANERYKEQLANMHKKHSREIEEVRNELDKHLKEYYCVNPSSLDSNTMTLLNTVQLSVDELKSLAEQNKNNPTMLRVIKSFTDKRKETTKDAEERKKALMLSATMDEYDNSISTMENFNALTDWAERALGYENEIDNGFSNRWDSVYSDISSRVEGIDESTCNE